MFAKAEKLIDVFRVSDEALPVVRYALGTTIIMGIAMGFAWELSFLTPVLALGFFAPGAKAPTFKQGFGFVVTVILCVMSGFIFTKFFAEYMLVFIPVLAVALFHVYYSNNLSGMAKIFMLIALTLIPMLGLQSTILSYAIAKSLIAGTAITILSVWLIYALFPDRNVVTVDGRKQAEQVKGPSEMERFHKAMETIVVVFPLLLAYFFFQWTGAIIVLIFVALLSMQPSFSAKAGVAMILGNLIGGVIAIVLFEFFVIVPQFMFFLMMILVMGLILGARLFSGHKMAPLFGMAFSTMILILGQSTSGTSDAGDKVWMRVIQIMLAVIYLVIALKVVDTFRSAKGKKEVDA